VFVGRIETTTNKNNFAYKVVSTACAQPPAPNLNKNAAGVPAALERKGMGLSLGNRRDSRKPSVVKAAHADAQENVARLFVSHGGGIIA